ncbi:MAG TPA: hypothetical protein PKV00_09640, partial [Thauera sp.]|nr:hypothetical protein [Thauera sp.]
AEQLGVEPGAEMRAGIEEGEQRGLPVWRIDRDVGITLRRTYAAQTERLRGLIHDAFPAGTRATQPSGGFLVWVELPEGCDTNRLFDLALRRGIGMTPGKLYSPSGRYTRHLRLSGCYPFSDRHVHALMTLGELAGAQLR